jgi:membrane associated rhomboid family serine protease
MTLVYAAALLATNIWLESAPRHTESRVLEAMSTNIAHLVHDPWFVLPASAFFTRGGLAVAIAGCLICVGLLEMSAGWRVTLAVAATGHVVGTLVSEGVEAVRLAAGDVPDSARHLLDVGPSYILVACATTVISSRNADRRMRFVCAVALAPVFVFTAWRLPAGRVDAIGHLTAAFVGVWWARWTDRRRCGVTEA